MQSLAGLGHLKHNLTARQQAQRHADEFVFMVMNPVGWHIAVEAALTDGIAAFEVNPPQASSMTGFR